MIHLRHAAQRTALSGATCFIEFQWDFPKLHRQSLLVTLLQMLHQIHPQVFVPVWSNASFAEMNQFPPNPSSVIDPIDKVVGTAGEHEPVDVYTTPYLDRA